MVEQGRRKKQKGTGRINDHLESSWITKKQVVHKEVSKEAENSRESSINLTEESSNNDNVNNNANTENNEQDPSMDDSTSRFVEVCQVLDNEKEASELSDLPNIRKQYKDKTILGQLNINSLRNKFSVVKDIIENNFDIFLISETKIDDSFPANQFKIQGFNQYRLDRNCFGGGLLLYIKSSIPSKIVKYENHYEGFFCRNKSQKAQVAGYLLL